MVVQSLNILCDLFTFLFAHLLVLVCSQLDLFDLDNKARHKIKSNIIITLLLYNNFNKYITPNTQSNTDNDIALNKKNTEDNTVIFICQNKKNVLGQSWPILASQFMSLCNAVAPTRAL